MERCLWGEGRRKGHELKGAHDSKSKHTAISKTDLSRWRRRRHALLNVESVKHADVTCYAAEIRWCEAGCYFMSASERPWRSRSEREASVPKLGMQTGRAPCDEGLE